MPQCQYYDICGRDVEGNSADGLCILHSTDSAKDASAFTEALATHRKRSGDNFFHFVFPGTANFRGATFSGKADFRAARFGGEADFGAAGFSKKADFGGATFGGKADFGGATFSGGADFSEARFDEKANFYRATFSERTRFTGRLGSAEAAGHIFAGTEVDFRQVVIDPLNAVTFVEADLTKCRFQDTDLRKIQLVGITWPQKGRWSSRVIKPRGSPRRYPPLGRVLIYDDLVAAKSVDGSMRPWSQTERLYRELKQNYEDRRDYERAGDFHYGEKEMRRQNPDTSWGLRLFLTLYWLFSGYGERYLRPLLWAGLLFVGSTIGYVWWGLRPKEGGSSLSWISAYDWLQAAYYSFRVMTLLKPDDWVPLRYAQGINTFQTLLGPVFLGLLALALRQRLKR